MTRGVIYLLLLMISATCFADYPSIFYAARANDLGIAAYYVASGESVDIKDEYGMTPLMYAAEKGNKEMVEFLLKHGADPTTEANGLSALGFTRSIEVRKILEHAIKEAKSGRKSPAAR